jgi:hypothetical protein
LQALLLELYRRYLSMVRNHVEVDFDLGFLAASACEPVVYAESASSAK